MSQSVSESHVFHRQLTEPLPVAVRGDGAYIIDDEGRRYLDASGGAAVSCLGYSHERVTQAIKDQLDNIAFAHTGTFTSEPAEALADFLIRRAPANIDRVYFVSGGSEAVESALKLARQFFLEKGETQRSHFIARRQSYHGNTLGALAVGGNSWRREPFDPLLMGAEHIAPCYPYRDKRPGETDEAYGLRVADELEQRILQLGAENVIAFVAEPIVGATAGVLVPVPGYFRRVRDICDRYGILLILDEVMCGMGRTGTLFACEAEGVAPDIITVAKGLGAGYQAIGAMMCTAEIYGAIRDGSGFFQHGHTYVGHPVACAAALAVQRVIEEDGLLAKVQRRGLEFETALRAGLGDHPHVGDIRGRGLFWGLELVADRATKVPFDPAYSLHARIKREALERGLMCYPAGGTIDGQRGNHILLAPPFIIDSSHIASIVDRLSGAIDSAISQRAAQRVSIR